MLIKSQIPPFFIFEIPYFLQASGIKTQIYGLTLWELD